MMRRARIPHTKCGQSRVCSDGQPSLQRTGALVATFGLVLALTLTGTQHAVAQDPSLSGPGSSQRVFQKPQGGIFGTAPKVDQAAPLNMEADQLVYDTKNNRVVARGNVQLFFNNFVLTADQVIYDQSGNKLIAEGNAQLKDPNGNITRGERIEATDDFRDAFVQKLSVITREDSRFAAQSATRRDGNVTEFDKGKFTPCKNDPGKSPLWCISAQRITHDQGKATISYQDAQFELFGVPVFWLPYFQHADPSVKRRSGFLAPSISHSTDLGFGLEVPYYFALAQNYDFTFNPVYHSKQGALWQGTWRHRLADGEYSIRGAAIDQDGGKLPNSVSADNRADLDGWRGTIETRGVFSLSSWWKYGWNVTLESDDSFRRFYKFDSVLQTDRVNNAFLVGQSERNYFATNFYHFGGLLLNDTNTSGSRVHPVIDYNYIWGAPIAGGELSFNGHARSMSRRSVETDPGTDTTHAVAEVSWRRKFVDAVGQLWTPFAHARGDVYGYQNARNPDNVALAQADDTVTRGFGAVGLNYSYPLVAHTGTASHILEPTAQIIARPNRVDQRRLPNEDAKSINYDDTLLFDIDKFSGFDRLETGTRANVGLQYTFQANTGLHTRLVFGQSFHLAGENAFANPGFDPSTSTGALANPRDSFSRFSGLETKSADYVAGLYMSPFAGLALIAQGRFDEKDFGLRRQDTMVTASYGPVSTAISYSYARAEPGFTTLDSQQDILLSGALRLTDHWTLLGSLRYDIDSKQRIQDSIGLRYADECFVLTANYQESFVENQSLRHQARSDGHAPV